MGMNIIAAVIYGYVTITLFVYITTALIERTKPGFFAKAGEGVVPLIIMLWPVIVIYYILYFALYLIFIPWFWISGREFEP